MSLSAEVFGSDSWIHKFVNIAGWGIPGWADRKFGTSTEAQQNGLGDIARQTADEGTPRTIVWGRVRPIGGNIIYCQKPRKKWVVSYQETEGMFGGGEDQEVWTQRVYRTYAIGICEGAISRIVRVWKNNKLVYDARGNAWGIKNNPRFLAATKTYLGGFSQLPCPELQSIWGSDIPAHRGTAYIVFINQDLTEFAGAVPQYQFEVERAEGTYLTSKPYAVEVLEAIESLPPELSAPFIVPIELIETGSPELVGGSLRAPLVDYSDGVPEAIEKAPLEILEGELRVALIDYSDGVPEAIEKAPLEILEGELRVALIDYSDGVPEAIDANLPQIIGGTLT